MQCLRRRSDIQRVFREGRRFPSPWAVLHARRRTREEGISGVPRLAIIAGRRFRTAVARNRARRVLRETCREILRDLHAPWDLLLVARPEVLTVAHRSRLETLTRLLRAAGVLAGKAEKAAATV